MHHARAVLRTTCLSSQLLRSSSLKRATSSRLNICRSLATQAGKGAALAAALRQIEASFGKGAIMQLGQRSVGLNVPVIRSGSIALDHALGVGGFPRGRVVEIFGPESSGKTTLALHVIAEAQKDGGSCCFIDAEHALSIEYAQRVGVDLNSLFLSQPDSGEQALEIADTLVRSGGADVVVIDSVAALVPKAELEGDMGDAHVALQARLMSQALRKLTSSLSRSNTLIIFINQIRSKVGVLFGSPDVTSGGNALKFYSSIRVEIRRTGQIKKGEEVVGNETRCKIVKNKLAPPFRTAEFEMGFGAGINRAAEAVDLGVVWGVFKRSGAWYAINDALVLTAVNSALEARARAPPESGSHQTAASASPKAPEKIATSRKKKSSMSKQQQQEAVDDAVAAAEAAQRDSVQAVPDQPQGAAEPAVPLAPTVAALGVPFAQGREKMKAFLQENPSVLQAAITAVKLAMRELHAPPASVQAVPVVSGDPVGASVSSLGGSLGVQAHDDDGDEDDEVLAAAVPITGTLGPW